MANLFRISRPVGRRRRGTAHYLSPCTSSNHAWISSLYYQFLILSMQFHKIMSLLQFIEQWSVQEFMLHMAPIVFNKCKRTLTSFHHMFTMSNEGKLFPHTTLFPLNSNVWNKTKPQRGKRGIGIVITEKRCQTELCSSENLYVQHHHSVLSELPHK